jgi:hypothetical protein
VLAWNVRVCDLPLRVLPLRLNVRNGASLAVLGTILPADLVERGRLTLLRQFKTKVSEIQIFFVSARRPTGLCDTT